MSRATLSAVELKSATEALAAPEATEEPVAGPAADEAFGERLLRLRTKAGIDRADVAKRMNVSAASVLGWEKGRVRPKRSRMAALAKILGVPAAELLGEAAADKVAEAIDRSRKEIARAVGVSADKVRIIVEY